MKTHDPKTFLDLNKYPLDQRESQAYKNLVTHCQNQLKELGAVELPGFLNKSAVNLLVEEAEKLDAESFHSVVSGNAYLQPIDENLPPDHPKRKIESTGLAVVAYDQFKESSPLKALYLWDPLKSFIADALGEKRLYRYADPMGALNIAIMKENDYLRWHFDQTDFVTSIAIQSSDKGGEFEYVPRIRSAENENFDAVAKVLNGDRSSVKFFPMVPGTLLLFQGRYSIHRVTEIKGSKKRHVALLAYDTKPNVKSTEHLQKMRYGRCSNDAGPPGST